jgi:hypothetical protein
MANTSAHDSRAGRPVCCRKLRKFAVQKSLILADNAPMTSLYFLQCLTSHRCAFFKPEFCNWHNTFSFNALFDV